MQGLLDVRGLSWTWSEAEPRQPPLQQPGWLGSSPDGVFRVPGRHVRPWGSIRAAGVDGGSVFFCVSYVSALTQKDRGGSGFTTS